MAESGGRSPGWLGLRSFYGRPAYHRTVEAAVYVAPEYQRRGIARALLAHALDSRSALGIATLLAFVFGHNDASLALFRQAGFADWGTAAPRGGARRRRARPRDPRAGD